MFGGARESLEYVPLWDRMLLWNDVPEACQKQFRG